MALYQILEMTTLYIPVLEGNQVNTRIGKRKIKNMNTNIIWSVVMMQLTTFSESN